MTDFWWFWVLLFLGAFCVGMTVQTWMIWWTQFRHIESLGSFAKDFSKELWADVRSIFRG